VNAVEPVPESQLTPADWVRVADQLEKRAELLEARGTYDDQYLALVYRREAARLRATWRTN
jgi:hypothetical protein